MQVRRSQLIDKQKTFFGIVSQENRFDVAAEVLFAEGDGLLFGPAAIDNEPLGEDVGEDALVHVELGQGEFQLVHVAVVADLLVARYGFQAGGGVLLNVGRDIGIPPVAVRVDVGKNPGVTDQFLIRDARQD